MKKIITLVMVLCLLLGVSALAEEAEKETGREEHALDIDEIIGACREAGNRIVKNSRLRRYEVDESLFPEGLSFPQKQEYINRALEYARGKRI